VPFTKQATTVQYPMLLQNTQALSDSEKFRSVSKTVYHASFSFRNRCDDETKKRVCLYTLPAKCKACGRYDFDPNILKSMNYEVEADAGLKTNASDGRRIGVDDYLRYNRIHCFKVSAFGFK
jgi:hypothetical protein